MYSLVSSVWNLDNTLRCQRQFAEIAKKEADIVPVQYRSVREVGG
ncbi:unnamed protein product [Prunus brigantina]